MSQLNLPRGLTTKLHHLLESSHAESGARLWVQLGNPATGLSYGPEHSLEGFVRGGKDNYISLVARVNGAGRPCNPQLILLVRSELYAVVRLLNCDHARRYV